MGNVRISKTVFRALLGVSICAVVAPILATRHLPFTDAPEHAALMATLARWNDPVFSGPYELALFGTQYLAYPVVGAALTHLTGDGELANRLLLAFAGIGFPLSFGALLRAAGRDDRLSIFACLPFWSRPLVLGFLPFVASIPLGFYALALFFRLSRARKRRARHFLGLAALATILFYAHVSTWMIVALAAFAVAIVSRQGRPLLAFVPSGLAASVWLVLGRVTLGSGTLADPSETSRMSVTRSLMMMPRWIFDVWRHHGDELAAVAWWIGFLVAIVASARFMARCPRRALLTLYAPFACALAADLFTPWRVGAGVMLNVRLAPILVLLAFLPTRLPNRGPLAAIAIGLASIANVAGGFTAMRESTAAVAELGDIDRVLQEIPPGARLMTLNFDIRSKTTAVFPWAHVAAYHRVRSGGVASFSFSELHHWPVQYKRSERPPPKPGTKWDYDPCAFRNATDGPYYDLVLVRGPIDPFVTRPAGPIFRPAATVGPMTLYRKEDGTWPPTEGTDPGPCPGR